MQLKKNETVVCRIDGITHDGMGVAHVDDHVLFVRHAARGDSCRAKLVKICSHVSYAILDELLEPSPHRIEPDCPHFAQCGGCAFRHIGYDEELSVKRERVEQTLRRLGGVTLSAEQTLPSPEIDRYRNKSSLPVGWADGRPVTGFYRPRSHDIIPVETCLLQKIEADRAAAALRQWLSEVGQCAVRHLVTRTGAHGTLVCVVGAGPPPRRAEALVSLLRQQVSNLVGVVWDEHLSDDNVIFGGNQTTLWGEDHIIDTLCGLTFRLSPMSFYQINRPQAERLYSRVCDYAGSFDTAVDLYCGAGTLTLCLARRGGHVTGVEIVESAVLDARANALRNGMDTEFLLMDAAKAALALHPDVVTVDPPRKGMSPEAVEAILHMAPKRIVYVSCDPATLARDLTRLTGYTAASLTALDMFPRTSHVECVVLLKSVKE